MVFLVISEFTAYWKVQKSTEMIIDVNRGGDLLKINIDIELPKMPCSILSLDVQDIMGSHDVNVNLNLFKHRISRNGKDIGKEIFGSSVTVQPQDDDMSNYEAIKKEILDHEGCHIYGDVFLKKVPGNFHISSHAFGHIVSRLAQEGHFVWDVSHKINHFNVGEISDIDTIKKKFEGGILSPLDGSSKIDNEKKVYEYYLKVTTFIIKKIN